MIKNILEGLFLYTGRLSRSGFVAYTVGTIVLALASLFVAQNMVGAIIFGTAGDATVEALGAFLALVTLVLGYVHGAVVVKRLHDLDISGYWLGLIALADLLCVMSDKEPGLTIVTFACTAVYLSLALVPGSKNVNYYSK